MRPRAWIGIMAAAAVLAMPAQASLRSELHGALAGYHGRGTGAIAVDLATGKAVYAHNAGASFLPASNEKLALSYAALVVLGPGYRLRTEVLGDGHLRDGVVWEGDLILSGHGDPTLDGAALLELARRLRAEGIRRVTGSLIADESWFDARRGGPGWKSYFVPEESSPLSALSVGGADALATAALFRKALLSAGVRVAGRVKRARAGGWPLAVRFSPPLEEILRAMDIESDNHVAELLLKQLGATVGRAGSTAAGAAVVRSVLADHEVPLAGVRIADGSGLSALDRLTPKALVTILQRAWADPAIGNTLARLLPAGGRDGTLRHRRLGPSVRAKTGTLTTVSALSGYVRGRYAFAILQNGSRLGLAHTAQDRFARVLAAQ